MDKANSAQWIFEQLIEIQEVDRDEAVQRLCGNRQSLLEDVQSLLKAHDSAAEFLELPFGDERFSTETCPRSGDQIGGYTLLEMIGEGGFGQVFLAERSDDTTAASFGNPASTNPLRTRVAIKLIKPGMATKEVLRRFANERQALSVMAHPNIARIFDAGATPRQTPYFVMELFQGLPLTKFCDEQRLTISERIQLFISVCSAIQHAHQKGIIHRDIKPSNVLARRVDGQIEFKVIDFGVAKAISPQVDDWSTLTAAAQLVGTPLYMSPEQVDNLLDIDVRADVYSLGTMLYELLTGTTPLNRKLVEQGHLEVRRAIREQPTPAASRRLSNLQEQEAEVAGNRSALHGQLVRMVRGDLDWIVLKALAKDRSQRYQSPDELGRDLQRFVTNGVVEARPPSSVYRFRKFVTRNRTACVAAAVGLLLLLGSTFVSVRHVRIARDAQETALEEMQRAESLAAIFIGDFDSTKPMHFDVDNGFAINVESRIDAFLNTPSPTKVHPNLKLDLLNVLSKIYFDSDNYPEAVRVMEQAREFAQSDAFSEKSSDAVEHNVPYGTLLCWSKEYKEAEAILRNALRDLDEHPDDFPLKSQCLIELGIAAHHLELEDARDLLKRASQTVLPNSPQRFRQIRRLVISLVHEGETQIAVRVGDRLCTDLVASHPVELRAHALATASWARRAQKAVESGDPIPGFPNVIRQSFVKFHRIGRLLDSGDFDAALDHFCSVLDEKSGPRIDANTLKMLDFFTQATADGLPARKASPLLEVLGDKLFERGFFGVSLSTYLCSIEQFHNKEIEPERLARLKKRIDKPLIELAKIRPKDTKTLKASLPMIIAKMLGEKTESDPMIIEELPATATTKAEKYEPIPVN